MTTLKKFAFVLALQFALGAMASVKSASETVDGVTWTYSISDGKARIGLVWHEDRVFHTVSAISTNTIGAVVIPPCLGGCPVSEIAAYAFAECRGVTSVVMPDSIEVVGNNAFSACSGLREIVMSKGVKGIAPCAFSSCKSLMSIAIPDGVSVIEESAFVMCVNLTSVALPKGVTRIGDDAFWGCAGLTSVVIPRSVEEIGMRAFDNCQALKTIYVSGNDSDRVSWLLYTSGIDCSAIEFRELQTAVSIIFDRNGGCGGTASLASVEYLMPMPTVCVPTREKYVFAGYWSEDGVQYVKADGSCAHVSSFTANTTLIAKWVPLGCYLIVFQSKGEPSYEQVYARDKVGILPAHRFSNLKDKRFKAWKGTNGKLYDDAVLIFNAANEGGILTLVAAWDE